MSTACACACIDAVIPFSLTILGIPWALPLQMCKEKKILFSRYSTLPNSDFKTIVLKFIRICVGR